MDKIKTVKIKNEDGSVSTESYNISADARNIDMANGYNVQDTIGTINVDNNGSVAEQLNNINDNINNIEIDIKKKAYYFDTITDMKNTSLEIGDMAITLGYYEVNDGGAGEYKIVNDNILIDNGGSVHNLINGNKAQLIIKDSVNVKQFGAYGDEDNDDTDAIQKAIDFAYDNGILSVFVPAGNYRTIKPLYLYDNIRIFGENSNSSTIHKTTSTKSFVNNFSYDAILILINRTLNTDDSSSVQNVKINGIKLKGNISSYVADKSEENVQYAILGVNNIPKTQISDFLISNVDIGIKARGLWTGWIKNCTWLQAQYRGIYISTETQGLNVQNINIGNTHICGIEVHGASYSTLTNILVEWIYGGMAYNLGNWSGAINNCGYELGNGPEIGFNFVTSRATLSGAYCHAKGPLSDNNNTMFKLNNTILKIKDSSIGYNVDIYPGSFATLGNNAHLIIDDSVNFICGFAKDIQSTDATPGTTLTIKNKTIQIPSSGKISFTKSPSSVNDSFIDSKINTIPFNPESNIYYDFINTPLKTSLKSDLQWQSRYNKGDIGIIKNSITNGKAMWLCNRNNKNDTPISEGTIATVNSNNIVLTSLLLENYQNTGLRFYTNCGIVGVTSGATCAITRVDYQSNTLYFNSLTGSFIEGEKVQLTSTDYARNGDYLYIPIIGYGSTNQRPYQSLVIGTMFFDTILGKPIWWNGSKWVDATGTQV